MGSITTQAMRAWTDADQDFVPDCDLLNTGPSNPLTIGGAPNPAYNPVVDTCGALSSSTFGLNTPGIARDPDTYLGWGNREWNQTFSAGVQHEVLPRLAVDVSYYRRWAGNFLVTDNRALAATDFTPYSIVAPTTFAGATIPLPDGAAGRTTSGFYDANTFGLTDNYSTLARKFGDQTDVWNGVDVTVNARMENGLVVQGGVSTGSRTTDNCEVRDALPEIGPTNPYCHVDEPLQTQLKFLATYLVPRVDVRIAATFQNNPGPVINAAFNVPAANIVGLGRPLSSGLTTVNYNLIEPNSLYGDRVTQFDLRFSKLFSTGAGTRLSVNFDLANALNRSDVLGQTNTYGTAWQTPQGILDARLFKLGVQFDF